MFSIHNFFRGINKNLRTIIIAIVVIIFAIGMIQLLNYIAKEQNKNEVNTQIEKDTYSEQKKSYSVVTDEKINEVTANKNINIINEFVNFCNEGKIEEAYSLISEDCKNIYYNTLEEFKDYYYNNIFTSKKIVDMQAWTNNNSRSTYKVELSEDILSTGKYEKDSYVEDYYTIVTDKDNNKKLNINSFIGIDKIDQTISKSNIKINCIQKEVHKEYEIYTFEVSNSTDGKIILDSRDSSGTVYLQGDNEAKYTAFMHELSDYNLEIDKGKTKEVKIKFNKFYNPDIKTNNIIFEDITLSSNENESKIRVNISIK